MRLRMLGLFIALLFVYACEFGLAPGGGGTGGEGLTGVVVDDHGMAVANAKVWVYPDSLPILAKKAAGFAAGRDSGTTNVRGRYDFRGLPAGRYNLSASYTRHDTTYALFIGGIDYKGGGLDLGADTLHTAGTLWVYVSNAEDHLIEGALCDIPGSPWRALSDSTGNCVLEGVAPGDLTVRVTAPGKGKVLSPVTLQPGEISAACQVSLFGPGEGGIAANWVLTSLQGYAYYLPPELILQHEGFGEDSWDARYESPSMAFQMGMGMVGPLDRPDSFPDYSEETRILDSTDVSEFTRGVLVSYRVPEPLQGIYGAKYVAGIQVYSHRLDVVLTGMMFRIACETPEDQEQALRILRSVSLWKGPGAAPVPPPLKPVLVSPRLLDTTSIQTSSLPRAVWRVPRGSTLTMHYRLQLSSSPTFVILIQNDSIPLDFDILGPDSLTEYIGPFNGSATHFYWRVLAVGPGGVTASETRSVHMLGAAPSGAPPIVPALQSPAANAKGLSVTPTLIWMYANGVATTDHYRVQVSTDSLFVSLLVNDSVKSPVRQTGLTTWIAQPALTEGRRYFWRVIGIGAGGATASETRSFETTPTGYAAVPIYPLAGATGVEWSPALTWSPYYAGNAVTYHRVQVSRDSLFLAFVTDDSIGTVSSNNEHGGPGRVVGPLEPGTRYYWRVVTRAEAVGFTYGRTQAFTTAAASGAAPSAPALVSPAENAVVFGNRDTLSFSWFNGGSATAYYHFQAASDSSFVDPVVNDSLTLDVTVVATRYHRVSLKLGQDYYWRMIGVGPGGITSSLIRKVTFSPFPPD